MNTKTIICYFRMFRSYIRNNKILKIILFLVILLLFLSILFKINFPSDIEILYWVFSSVVQSLVALIALIGLVVVYRLGIISNQESLILDKKSKNLESLLSMRGDTIPVWSSLKSEQKFKEIEESISDKQTWAREINEIQVIYSKLNILRKNKDELRKFFITTSIFISSVVVLQLFLLMLTNFIIYEHIGLPTLVLTFALVVYSLYRSVRAISVSLRDCQL